MREFGLAFSKVGENVALWKARGGPDPIVDNGVSFFNAGEGHDFQ